MGSVKGYLKYEFVCYINRIDLDFYARFMESTGKA
jgi:hypothetical protein